MHPQESLNSKQGEDTFYMWSIRSNTFLPVKRNCYAKSNRAFNLQCVNTWVNVWYSLLYFSPLYLPLFICKTCPVVLQLQHSLPSWCIYSSFQLDSDIYVHLLHTIVRHLEGLVPFSPLTFSFFPSPDKNMNADLRATVSKSLLNGCISGSKQENASVMRRLCVPFILWSHSVACFLNWFKRETMGHSWCEGCWEAGPWIFWCCWLEVKMLHNVTHPSVILNYPFCSCKTYKWTSKTCSRPVNMRRKKANNSILYSLSNTNCTAEHMHTPSPTPIQVPLHLPMVGGGSSSSQGCGCRGL